MPKYVSRRKNEEEEEEEKETRSKLDFHPEPITLIKAGNCDRATIRTSHGSKINGRALHHFHRTRTVWLSHTLISPPTSLYPRRGSAKPRVKERGCHVRGRRPPVALRVISWRWTRDKLRAPSNRTSESRSGRNCVNIFRNDSLGRFDGRISNSPIQLSRSFDRIASNYPAIPSHSVPFLQLGGEKGWKDDDRNDHHSSLGRVVTSSTPLLLSRSNFVEEDRSKRHSFFNRIIAVRQSFNFT